MHQIGALVATLTGYMQARWTRFWRWYRHAGRRTQLAVGISTAVGVLALSSLAVATFHPGARTSGVPGAPAHVAQAAPATHVSTPGPTHHPKSTGKSHAHHGRGRHISPRSRR